MTFPPYDEPYKVGYGKPPIAHRLKPGESGNRRGRPRRSHSTAAVFEAMFRSTVSLTVDGKRCTMTVREMMALRAKKELAGGNVRSIERWLPYAERVGLLQANLGEQLIDLEGLTEEQLRVLASIKIDWTK